MPLASRILLWLFVLNLGVAFGAGLYESRVMVPQWLLPTGETGAYRWDPAAARTADSGLRFWVYVTTGPLTLLTIANLVAAWRVRGLLRRWWLGAVATVVVERVMTFGYFVPTMLTLMQDTVSQPEAVATAMLWTEINVIRHILVLAAWLAALRTFSMMDRLAPGQTFSSAPSRAARTGSGRGTDFPVAGSK